ncbi:MAG: hypothetical protein KDA84_17365 [Planctomycetaceae bacterium]|nr:hypothetical protein [Planctomycetaceae bacterium]
MSKSADNKLAGYSIQYPYAFGGTISSPASVVQLVNGTFTAYGTHDGNLRAVFAAALPGNPATPANPYDSNVPAFAQGTFNAANETWEVQNTPGARGNCLTDKFVVWFVLEDDAEFHADETDFKGDSAGSGCGSGSGSYYELPSAIANLSPSRVIEADAVPRVYRMSIDVHSLNLDRLGGNYLTGGLLRSGDLYLTHDAHLSTPAELVWSAQNLADADGLWTLRVSANDLRLSARLDYRRVDRRSFSKPCVWSGVNWRFDSANTLRNQSNCGNATVNPNVRIEPA